MGTGPVPITFMTIVVPLNIWNTVLNALEIASNRSEACSAVGSARFASIKPFSVAGDSPASPGEANAMSGMGMFGIGGATGAGTAAKAGYEQDSRSTRYATAATSSRSRWRRPVENFSSIGVALGAEERINGMSGGPTTHPG